MGNMANPENVMTVILVFAFFAWLFMIDQRGE